MPAQKATKEGASSGTVKQTTLQIGASRSSVKHTLAMSNGDDLDLSKSISNPTAEIVEAMRLRILQLEDKLNTQAPPAKQPRTSAAASEPAPEASSSKTDEKKRKMQVKQIFDRLKKECKSDNVKFQGAVKKIKFDDVYEVAAFEALFGGRGKLIQPMPDNKPKSAVTIIRYETQEHIQSFFGDELKPLKGNRWSRGGAGTHVFGGPFGFGGSGFAKSQKLGPCNVSIWKFEVNYSKNNLKCTIKFEVCEAGMDPLNYNGDDSDS